MENVAVIGILFGLALSCEWWLRRHGAKGRPPKEDAPVDIPIRSLPVGLPEAFRTKPSPARPSTPSLN
jgi:hypothetical protein